MPVNPLRKSKIAAQFVRRNLELLVPAPVLLVWLGCAPVMVIPPADPHNPIEMIERSPRVYRVVFEAFGDSLETLRASTYLAGGVLPVQGPGTHRGGREGTPDKSALAEVEIVKASKRLDAGAVGAAVKHLRQALEYQPNSRRAYLLLGEAMLDQGAMGEALEIFSRLVADDLADSEALTGLGTCYLRTGRSENAREALVDALIFNRANLSAWRKLKLLGSLAGFEVRDHDAPELAAVRPMGGRHFDIRIDTSVQDCPAEAAAWMAFASERAAWRYEGRYAARFGGGRYTHTYDEDIDCYLVLAAAWKTLASADTAGCGSQYLYYLTSVSDEGYLVPHVLFDYVCLADPKAARYFPIEILDRLRDYVNRYVIVPKG